MANVKKIIDLTEEEKEILVKAEKILKDISLDLEDEDPQNFTNGEYVTNILDIPFEY